MPHSTIHLLRSIGRQVVTAVAIVALLLTIFRVPCLLADTQKAVTGAVATISAVSSDSTGTNNGPTDADNCGFCHCSVSTACVIPDAAWSLPQLDDGRNAQRPASSRVPETPARTPDVPPDQA